MSWSDKDKTGTRPPAFRNRTWKDATGRGGVSRTRWPTPEERFDAKLLEFETIVKFYPFARYIPRSARNRWGETIRSAGASGVVVPVSDTQCLLLLSVQLGQRCQRASDLRLSGVVACTTNTDRNRRMGWIGPRLCHSTRKPQVSPRITLATDIDPGDFRAAARKLGMVTKYAPNGGCVIEGHPSPARWAALLATAREIRDKRVKGARW